MHIPHPRVPREMRPSRQHAGRRGAGGREAVRRRLQAEQEGEIVDPGGDGGRFLDLDDADALLVLDADGGADVVVGGGLLAGFDGAVCVEGVGGDEVADCFFGGVVAGGFFGGEGDGGGAEGCGGGG